MDIQKSDNHEIRTLFTGSMVKHIQDEGIIVKLLSEINDSLKEQKNGFILSNKISLDCNALSHVTNFTVNQIRYYVRMGLIPHMKVGKHLLFSPDKIKEWINGGGCDQLRENPIKASKRNNKKK